ncbi:glycosyltransferase family 4 protein [Candidatus Uhrbacteria bacterium]|nr:glycosyltransferase family 4 protein [Candidatus Uhrbacteria bacterium]
MQIGIDLRCIPAEGDNGAGIPHASRELVRALLNSAGHDDAWTLYLPKNSASGDGRSLFQECYGKNCRIVKIASATGGALRKALSEHPCQILLVPSGAVALGMRMPVVPWVHDIAIFDHPEWFPQSIFQRTLTTNLFRKGITKAPRVLAVSEFTKSQLVSHFSLDVSRINVTWEGGDHVLANLRDKGLAEAKQRARARMKARGIDNPFILCLGTLEPRKNIPTLLKAWSQARLSFRRRTDLVIAGRDGWKLGPIMKSLDTAKAGQSGINSHLHRIETPTDEHRRDLLLAADAVALPSLYEGFGLVALEAMQAGTAVLASTSGALPEVIGQAGVLLQSEDTDAWRDALVDLIDDHEKRRQLADAGKSRSLDFTWENAARVAYGVLTQVKA